MAKDRSRPFSRKHRKYWITVTGGMLLICGIDVALGMCAYKAPVNPERIIPVLPPPGSQPPAADGTIGLADIPAPVMRAFAVAYPRHIPAPRKLASDAGPVYELSFTDAGKTRRIVYKADGTFVAER